jgi:hypothetical protein
MSVAADFAPTVLVPERARRGRSGSESAATVLPFRPPVLSRVAPPAQALPRDAPLRAGSMRDVSLREAADAVPRWYPVLPEPASSASRPDVEVRTRPVRLTSRGYAVVGVLAASLVTAMLWLAHASADAGSVTTNRPPAVVTVHDGDTLWSIASHIAPQSDPRVVVARLERVNHLSDPILQPGQRLRTE